MTPSQWIVLDNLNHGWIYSVNLCDKIKASNCLEWAKENGFVDETNRITAEGESALLIANCGPLDHDPIS